MGGDTPKGGFDSHIRIGIVISVERILLEGDAEIRNENQEKVGSIQGRFDVRPVGSSGVRIGSETYTSRHLKVHPKFSFLSIGSKIFRGNFDIYNINGQLTVVNELPLDDYVKGVINKEILSSWSLEAKKVQAVLARTYAVYQKIYNRRSDIYDLSPTVLDQVYGGLSKEDMSANDAVAATSGEIISYGNMPAQIFFHSTCGGETASSSNVWGKDVPYLKSVSCPYCRKSSLYRWKRVLSSDQMGKRLRKNGIKVSRIRTISVRRKGDRVTHVDVDGIKMKVDHFRRYVGYSVVWSNSFTVDKDGKNFIFRGRGAGHGVGCCQWGMAEMAKKGMKYRDIISYYFKNIEIKKIY